MFVPDYLKDYPHLPLKPGTTSSEAVELCNSFYGTSYRADDFIDSQAFVDVNECLVLELITHSGEIPIIFKNRSIGQFTKEGGTITLANFAFSNPLEDEKAFMVPAVRIDCVGEIDFLKEVVQGDEQDIFNGDQELFYQLAQLLNRHEVIGRWAAGSLNPLTTAGFTLVYYGEAKDVPEGFIIPTTSKTVAIVKINHGDKKGYLCLSS